MPRPRLSLEALTALRKPARAKPPHAADINTFRQIKRAVYFRACTFLGQQGAGKPPFSSEAFNTLAAARASLGDNPRSVVYAVSPEGYTTHVPRDYQEGEG